MKLRFRHGIVRHQTDIAKNPTHLKKNTSGKIDLVVSPDPFVYTIAHGKEDYLFEESKTVSDAWVGPFAVGTTYYLFIETNQVTGERTFQQTTIEPEYGSTEPTLRPNGLFWFDTKATELKKWNGVRWSVVIALFVGEFQNGANVVAYASGTRVGLYQPCYAGYLLFDNDNRPVKKFHRFNQGTFITTETPLSSQSNKIRNFHLETVINTAEAIEHIPQWSCISYAGPEKIRVASSNDVTQQAVGVVSEEYFTHEYGSYVTEGHVSDPNWNWSQEPGTYVFCAADGSLSTIPPQFYSAQRMGYITSPTTIYIDIQPQMLLGDPL